MILPFWTINLGVRPPVRQYDRRNHNFEQTPLMLRIISTVDINIIRFKRCQAVLLLECVFVHTTDCVLYRVSLGVCLSHVIESP